MSKGVNMSIDPLPSNRRPWFQEQMFLILMMFNLSVFSLMVHTFAVALSRF